MKTKLKKIPEFKTIEEEAEFWDTHDSTEYIDWTKAVKVSFSLKKKPVRIQKSRQHKMISPNGLPIVYVGRPSKWGNPIKVAEDIGITREKAVEQFAEIFLKLKDDTSYKAIREIKEELGGKNLACWCPLDQKCHADILIEVANS